MRAAISPAFSPRVLIAWVSAPFARIMRMICMLPVLAAAMTGSMSRGDLASRIAAILDTLRAVGANLGVTSADEVLALGSEPMAARNIIVIEGGRYRVRERHVLRYYARSIAHLLTPPSATH